MGKSLVIVESPAKARTIEKFLGDEYIVAPSIGHVRDLPESAAEIPARYKGLPWARLGVNVEDRFQPLYVVPSQKKEQVRKLRAMLKEAESVYLATDEDREGESISWHLLQVLKPKVPVHRLVFHEITREAIKKALRQPRGVDERLVQAQEARRVLDRLFGYEVSPLLWRKIRPRLSAGRVQSVAVRLVVERERQRIAFQSAGYWRIQGRFEVEHGEFGAVLAKVGGRSIAQRGDFDAATGRLKPRSRKLHLDAEGARALVAHLNGLPGKVASADESPFEEKPSAPFITSTMQQEANRKLRWTARRTMQVAQRLYENGWITYMRTDSTNLSKEAISAARKLIEQRYGDRYLPPRPRIHKSKSRLAQEAHEAIRPAGSVFRPIEKARGELAEDAARLYELIWKRTVASQMTNARGLRLRIAVHVDDAIFKAAGKTITFAGFRKAYIEGTDDGNQRRDLSQGDLPPMSAGEAARTLELKPLERHTQPPARLTEATLVKELETRGIGRPSTYATIIDTIQERGYVFKKGNALVPTFTAFSVTDLLSATMTDLVDYTFTARMEHELDLIALGERHQEAYLREFYSGGESTGLRPLVEDALSSVDAREVCTLPLARSEEGIVVRIGRFGAYLSVGEQRADIPDDMPPDEMNAEIAKLMLEEQARWPFILGADPASGKVVQVMKGPYGPYVQLGEAPPKPAKGKKKKPAPPRASLLKGMEASELDLATALALLSLPRDLGAHPDSGERVLAANGRYGPYLRCGSVSRSLPAGDKVLRIGLEEALQVLSQPAKRRGGASSPARELGAHPDSGAKIRLRKGRYGPYVTDGSTNASIPRGREPESVTLDDAVELLRARAARPARRRKAARRKKKK